MPGLLLGIARAAVVAGPATAVSRRVQRRQQGRWAAAQKQEAADARAPPEPAVPAPHSPTAPTDAGSSTDDKPAQLKQLGTLRDAGVLNDAEFENEKRKILGG
ncbi:MAG: hypothetical protein QOF52_1612 [Propionibacteriaceae bacterium]|jgi:hypothetical protein|nr:hypothetical protein [Propionibacteriaceae bacterium]MDX6321754.1 hypothetical protein [Propionibacteriaceae bacterium]